MEMRIRAACICCGGTERDKNEDNFLFDGKCLEIPNSGMQNALKREIPVLREPMLAAVFDGIGGSPHGDLAAYTASRAFQKLEKAQRLAIREETAFLKELCALASAEVKQKAAEIRCGKMGAAAAALYITGTGVFAANLGDSCIFRLRGRTLEQISQDHTDENILRRMGLQRTPTLLQYIGAEAGAEEPAISMGTLQRGDWFLLCTDGLLQAVPPKELHTLASAMEEPGDLAENILRRLKTDGCSDDATLIAVKIG